MTTTIITLDKVTRDAQWTEHYRLALHIAKDKLRYEVGSLPPSWMETRDEAMTHAWLRFEQICAKRPDVDAKTRVRWATKIGVLRARTGRRIVKTHEREYVDAMDGRVGREAFFDATAPTPTGYRDPSDRTIVESIIDHLPVDLQPVARLFSYGMTKDQVAERRSISVRTVYRLVEELRKLVPAILPEPAEVAEPVRRFCPVRAMLTAIAIGYEHNRCHRPESVAYVVDDKHLILEDR